MAIKANVTPTHGPAQTPPVSHTTPAAAAESVPLQPATHPAAVSEEKVRARAYFLWDHAGRPAGDGAEFWLRAEQELKAPR